MDSGGVPLSPLSPNEEAALNQYGTAEEVLPNSAEAEDALASAQGKWSREARNHSMSVAETAALLGVETQQVHNMISSRRLWAGMLGDEVRVPVWQFTDGRPLPHLAEVVAALPADAHSLTVEAFFTTANEELDGLAPAEWLSQHSDPSLVVALARYLTVF